MAQQFEQPSEMQSHHGSEVRTQRMTADESRAVIALWQQERVEQTGLTDKPAVPDVAEGLDITVEDVQRLPQDVRAKRLEEERALTTEQELSKIRLAEEERQLAEVRRQRAELRREQAEADRRRQTIYPRYAWPPTYPRQEHSEPRSLYTKTKPNKAGAVFVAVIACITVIAFLQDASGPHPPQNTSAPSPVTVSDESATYDAQGKIKSFHVTCADGTGTIPCDSTALDLEKSYLQNKHDKEVADAKAAAVKKKHDR